MQDEKNEKNEPPKVELRGFEDIYHCLRCKRLYMYQTNGGRVVYTQCDNCTEFARIIKG